MRGDHDFEIARIDVEAARDDHVLAAVHQLQEAICIEASDIAGADEAFARGIAPFGLGGLVRLIMIAVHHRRRMTDDFTDSARADFATVLVDQTNVVTL